MFSYNIILVTGLKITTLCCLIISYHRGDDVKIFRYFHSSTYIGVVVLERVNNTYKGCIGLGKGLLDEVYKVFSQEPSCSYLSKDIGGIKDLWIRYVLNQVQKEVTRMKLTVWKLISDEFGLT